MARSILKRDRFKNARGGWSRILKLSCSVCNRNLMYYQKDGEGSLKRLYLDRIISPSDLAKLENKPISELPNLICKGCNELLGTPFIYKTENRKAFRLYQDAVNKEIIKQTKTSSEFQAAFEI